MRRSLALAAALFLTLALAMTPAAAGVGNVNFVGGTRSFGDDDLFEEIDSQSFGGVTVDFGPDSWPVTLAIGLYGSFGEEENIFGEIDLQTAVSELSFGVHKVWKVNATRPFVGGGLTSVSTWAEFEGPGDDVDDTDTSVGLYVQGGVFWKIGSRFNIGIDGRLVTGTDVEMDFDGRLSAEGDADYFQVGLLLGWGWPAE